MRNHCPVVSFHGYLCDGFSEPTSSVQDDQRWRHIKIPSPSSSPELCGVEEAGVKSCSQDLTIDGTRSPLEKEQHTSANVAPEAHQEKALSFADRWGFSRPITQIFDNFISYKWENLLYLSVSQWRIYREMEADFMVAKSIDRGLCRPLSNLVTHSFIYFY